MDTTKIFGKDFVSRFGMIPSYERQPQRRTWSDQLRSDNIVHQHHRGYQIYRDVRVVLVAFLPVDGGLDRWVLLQRAPLQRFMEKHATKRYGTPI